MICYVEGFVVRVAVLTALVWCEVLQFLAFPENSAFPFAVLVYPKMVSENPKAGSPATSENHGYVLVKLTLQCGEPLDPFP